MSVSAPSRSDPRLRRRLRIVVSLLAWIGLCLAAVPFVESLLITGPERPAAPLRVPLDGLAPGQALQVKWGGRPVWIVHRSSAQRAALREGRRSPAGADARFAAFYALVDGCTLIYQGPRGFFNPCSGAAYDVAGRHLAHSAPGAAHLARPPYRILDGRRLEISSGP